MLWVFPIDGFALHIASEDSVDTPKVLFGFWLAYLHHCHPMESDSEVDLVEYLVFIHCCADAANANLSAAAPVPSVNSMAQQYPQAAVMQPTGNSMNQGQGNLQQMAAFENFQGSQQQPPVRNPQNVSSSNGLARDVKDVWGRIQSI